MKISPKNKHIIVNYHHVSNPHPPFGVTRPCTTDVFEKQIAWLSEHFIITTVDKVFEAAQNRLPENYCALTFDDGLKDQYTNAVPILKKYTATAIFFPITGIFDGFIPSTHRLHVLLSRFSAKELVDACNIFLNSRSSGDTQRYIIPADHRLTDKRKLRDDILTANLKETLNLLPHDVGIELLAWLFKEFNCDEKELAKTLFMTEDKVAQLAREHFSIGSHTHRHGALDALGDKSIREELRLSRARLEAVTKQPITIISYPHGGVNNTVTNIAKEEGFLHGVTIERRGVDAKDSPFLIPRYDTKDLEEI